MGVLLVTTNAKAACGDPRSLKTAVRVKLPFLEQVNPDAGSNSIVGLWHVTYTADGQLFYEAFDEWHSDGTEFESANAVPNEGNVCVGVWKEVGTQNVHLSHIGWTFDTNGN